MERKKEEEAIGVCQKIYDFLMNKSLHGIRTLTQWKSSSKNKNAQVERVTKKLGKVGVRPNDHRRKEEVNKVESVDGEVKIERNGKKKVSAVDVPVQVNTEMDNIDEKLKIFLQEMREKILISEFR